MRRTRARVGGFQAEAGLLTDLPAEVGLPAEAGLPMDLPADAGARGAGETEAEETERRIGPRYILARCPR